MNGTTGKRRFTLLFKSVDVEAALADLENSLKKEEDSEGKFIIIFCPV
jgi:hypothetical protein